MYTMLVHSRINWLDCMANFRYFSISKFKVHAIRFTIFASWAFLSFFFLLSALFVSNFCLIQFSLIAIFLSFFILYQWINQSDDGNNKEHYKGTYLVFDWIWTRWINLFVIFKFLFLVYHSFSLSLSFYISFTHFLTAKRVSHEDIKIVIILIAVHIKFISKTLPSKKADW